MAIFTSFTWQAAAQNDPDFETALRKIIADSASFFSSFKGKAYDTRDTQYYSTITIPGTFDNRLTSSVVRCFGYYNAGIAKTVSEKKAHKLLEKWKQKLLLVVNNEFSISETNGDPTSGKPVKEYRFVRGNLIIVLLYFDLKQKAGEKKAGLVELNILYSLVGK